MNVLDLYAGLEGWSAPFRDRGHNVVSLDVDPSFGCDITADIFEWTTDDLTWRPDIILASPPCEGFTIMRLSRNWDGQLPLSALARVSVQRVQRALDIIEELDPKYFIIENPRGQLRQLPLMAHLTRKTVTYCQYGESYQKPTDLWGGFPEELRLISPCGPRSDCHMPAPRGQHALGSIQGSKRGAERAKVPYQLALQVCKATERSLKRAYATTTQAER